MTLISPENKDVTQIPQDKIETNAVEINQTQNKDQNTNEIKETNDDPNWKAFREARKKDRADREAAERKAQEKEAEVAALKAAMEAAFSKSAPNPQAYQQYYGMNQSYDENEASEDQKIEKKVEALLAQREEKSRRESFEREKTEYPNRLVKDFPDFNHVISQENLDYIDYHYPEVSRPLQRLHDGYDKWSDIYHAIKKFVPNHAHARKDADRAEANQMKPKSIASTGLTQSGESSRNSFQEVEQRRAENWQRMQKLLKSV